MSLNIAPTVNYKDHLVIYSYLHDVSNDSTFASSILQVLIKKRRTVQRTRWNENRSVKEFKVGDVVNTHIQVQFNANTWAVKKLSYQARVPFQIKDIFEEKSYLVYRYDSTFIATMKYKRSELYLLPPSLFFREPLDTMDQRYLYLSFTPIVSLLKKDLYVDLYNDTYFSSKSKYIKSPTLDLPSYRVDE